MFSGQPKGLVCNSRFVLRELTSSQRRGSRATASRESSKIHLRKLAMI
jgi:hypothetical protein